jgi:hypothetical protein
MKDEGHTKRAGERKANIHMYIYKEREREKERERKRVREEGG